MNSWLPPDTHTHTRLCRHAGGDPLDYARAAAERGIPEIACTDHIPFPNDPNPTLRMTWEEFPAYLDLVRNAQREGPVPVLLGIEADYEHHLVYGHIQSILDSADFDIVLGSLHSGGFWELTPDHPATTPERIEQIWRTYFQQMTELARTELYDVCSHFDVVKRTGIRAPDALMAEIILPALDAVAAAGMAIELNTSGLTHGAAEAYPSLQILSWMNERDIPLTFGSDAHNPDQIGQHFEDAVALARAAGHTRYARFRRRKMTLVPFPER